MHFSLLTTLALTFIGFTFAGNRELYIRYTDGVNREGITKVVSVENSERYASDLGSADTVVGANWKGTQRIIVNHTTREMITEFARNTLTGKSTVVFVAEKTAEMSKEPNFDEPCWYRVSAGQNECLSRGPLSSDYLVEFTIYDKIVFFVPVGAFNEAISDERHGVAYFHENTGEFRPATKVTDGNNQSLEGREFSFASYCAVGNMIALQYDKNRISAPNFAQDGWEYYRISKTKGAVELERVTI